MPSPEDTKFRLEARPEPCAEHHIAADETVKRFICNFYGNRMPGVSRFYRGITPSEPGWRSMRQLSG